MAELSNIGSGNRAMTSRALKRSSALESGTARSPNKWTLCKTRQRASSSLIMLIISVSNRRLATAVNCQQATKSVSTDANYELEIQNCLRYSRSALGEVAEWSKAALC